MPFSVNQSKRNGGYYGEIKCQRARKIVQDRSQANSERQGAGGEGDSAAGDGGRVGAAGRGEYQGWSCKRIIDEVFSIIEKANISVLNVKALVDAFFQVKALLAGVFSVIIKTDGSFIAPIREAKRLSKYQKRQEKKDKIIMKTERKLQEKEIQLVEMETILLQIDD